MTLDNVIGDLPELDSFLDRLGEAYTKLANSNSPAGRSSAQSDVEIARAMTKEIVRKLIRESHTAKE